MCGALCAGVHVGMRGGGRCATRARRIWRYTRKPYTICSLTTIRRETLFSRVVSPFDVDLPCCVVLCCVLVYTWHGLRAAAVALTILGKSPDSRGPQARRGGPWSVLACGRLIYIVLLLLLVHCGLETLSTLSYKFVNVHIYNSLSICLLPLALSISLAGVSVVCLSCALLSLPPRCDMTTCTAGDKYRGLRGDPAGGHREETSGGHQC